MRIFEENISEKDARILLSDENTKHVSKVMRKTEGDIITVCDGRGLDFECVIEESGRDGTLCRVLSVSESTGELPFEVTVYAALSKGDRFETLIQKCVELGAAVIVPFSSENCVVKLDAKERIKKVERYRKIARDAGKQSGRGVLPKVEEIVTFEEAAEKAAQKGLALFLYECEELNTVKMRLDGKMPSSLAIVSGPEGGFSKIEAVLAEKAGLLPTTLGKRILRCETAPMAALAAVCGILEC